MTLKEFAEKYNIPYKFVYDASYMVHYYQESPFDRKTYSEQALYKAVVQLLESRIARHRKNLDDLINVMDTMKKM